MSKKVLQIKICLFLSFFLLFGVISAVKADTIGEKGNFYIDSSFDLYNRGGITARLLKMGDYSYFYVDNNWWDTLSSKDRERANLNFANLSEEFDKKIYPTLTSKFGSEWKPGIDDDNRVTVLFHLMNEGDGGYFNNGDEYSRFQNSRSNQREMVYINANYISSDIIKSFLAHEFVHLITFNQKERIRGVQEEIWLNETRAEYAPTLCGYDEEYQGSNLQNRVNNFLNNPSDPLTEWKGLSSDYGIINIFIHYLTDHYGYRILVDSLHSPKVGIESISYALEKNGFERNFSQIFTDWTIAVLVNDCSLGEEYCYKNENLKNLRIVPESNFLPLSSESSLSVNHTTKNWAGNWQKIFGGKDTLTFEFKGGDGNNFRVPYLLCEKSNECSIDFLSLDKNQNGEIVLKDFNKKYTSLTIIPSLQNKLFGFDGIEPTYLYDWKATISDGTDKEAELIEQLLAQIDYLRAEIAKVQAQITAVLAKKSRYKRDCQEFDKNLYYGMKNDSEIFCLQQFLKNQGTDIYPEELITGNFLSLTKLAVIRFQEKYAQEILTPLGLSSGTGYVGPATREKINELIGL